MNKLPFDTRAALLKSGRKEFLQKGFEGASLRAICADAHVSTGAFYAQFSKKSDLFEALVHDELADYMKTADSLMAKAVFAENVWCDDYREAEFMDYVIEHRDMFKLLFDCSEGTVYENFKEELINHFYEGYQRSFEAHIAGPVDFEVTKVLVKMKFAQYEEMIYGDYSREQVRKITRRVAVFTEGGFNALVEKRNKVEKNPA